MTEQISEDNSVPPAPTSPPGAFDWLVESHRETMPLAPLSDEVPSDEAPSGGVISYGALSDGIASPAAPTFSFGYPEPQAPPAPPVAAVPPTTLSQAPPPEVRSSFPLTFTDTPPVAAHPVATHPFAAAPVAAQPVETQAPPPVPEAPAAPAPAASAAAVPVPGAPAPFSFDLMPSAAVPTQASAPTTFSFDTEPPGPSPLSGGGFGLERRQTRSRSGNGPLDWAAFVFAFLAPPAGLLLGLGAVIAGSRTKGYVTGIAKAAIVIGAILSIVLGVAFAVYTKVSHDQAAHDSIVASSRGYCAALKSNPATLTSDTFGWPSPGDTIPASIAPMQQYESRWESVVKLAPTGIRAGTQKIASAAKSIVSSVQSTQTLNDASNVAQMQNAVTESGVNAWVTRYCP